MGLLRGGMHVHLVGIGGIGLSAIARVLHGWGYRISGSDQATSALTEQLAAEGIEVHAGHQAEHVSGADIVLASSAVPEDNAELVEARRQGLPVLRREQFLGELTDGKQTIAIAGVHGKTTTTAMIAWMLIQAGTDPSFVVGGVMQNLGTNAGAGTGPQFVIEADEYDRAFLGLRPDVAVITALEHDHPDCYPTFEEMEVAILAFAERVKEDGLLIVSGDDPGARRIGEIRASQGQRVETYGFDSDWDWRAESTHLGNSAAFQVWHKGRQLGMCALQLPGSHNVLNALAALAANVEVGIAFDTAAAALARFRGTERRFEIKGQVASITVVDDYAHHPTEIRATLGAARLKFPGRPIWAVFQPHTYSRTAALADGFAAAFGDADHVLVTEVYAARERHTLGVSGADLVRRMDHADAEYAQGLDDAVTTLLARIQPGDVIITLGAGDGHLVGTRVLKRLEERGGNE
jgi:UDP-N-acetylmuramate--alanine ligase